MKFRGEKLEKQIKEIIEYIVMDLGVDLGTREERVLKEMLEDLVQDVKDNTITKAIDLLNDM